MQKNKFILNQQYELIKMITSDEVTETWVGKSHHGEYLIKLWKYKKENYTKYHALWQNEIRILYRLSSSANAYDCIMTLHDAVIDEENSLFVMICKGHGYNRLVYYLSESYRPANEAHDRWHHHDQLAHYSARKKIWKGLKNIALAIQLLHQQSMIHRNISAESIYFDRRSGAESFKLGGFEWAFRLGNARANGLSCKFLNTWCLPPEAVANPSPPYAIKYVLFAHDWYAFGILIARTFFEIEGWRARSPADLNRLIYERIQRDHVLSPFERHFILRLIDIDPQRRLMTEHDILASLNYIIASLQATFPKEKHHHKLLLLVNRHLNYSLRESLRYHGFIADPKKPTDPYNPDDIHHIVALKEFIQKDFTCARLYVNEKAILLIGNRLIFKLSPYKDRQGHPTSWDLAYIEKAGILPTNLGSEHIVDLSHVHIELTTLRELNQNHLYTLSQYQSWSSFIPQKTYLKPILSQETELFHQFLQCTNQLEILIRDSEIFECVVFEYHPKTENDPEEIIILREVDRTRPVAYFCRIEGGLIEFLQRELESNKLYCNIVLLTDTDSLKISLHKQSIWEIVDLNRDDSLVTLKRCPMEVMGELEDDSAQSFTQLPEDKQKFKQDQHLYIRTWGHYGQIKLIERRKKAIDNLRQYPYLLRALAEPHQVMIDTGRQELPYPLSPEKVDESKIAIIQDVLRGRPIYALQGPPGTGKTTLVAHLLREILQDDPMAQILITAQAHGAVDVLKDKVRSEVFKDVADVNMPLSVRLTVDQNTRGHSGSDIREVGYQLLNAVQKQILSQEKMTPLQQEWLNLVQGILTQNVPVEFGSAYQIKFDLEELVKRGSNITYCTTSHKELELLAETSQSFDWSIVEEAGKAHGFDLALPMQTGHRWLLLGDHKQLPPYRYQHYTQGIEELDSAIEALNMLPGRSDTRLIDQNWIYTWEEKHDEFSKNRFKSYARRWIKTFAELFTLLSSRPNRHQEAEPDQVYLTSTDSVGAAAGILSLQYRMHPTISHIISKVFYKGLVKNAPLCSFYNLQQPSWVQNKAVIWINTPWCQYDPAFEELGPKVNMSRYTNPQEVAIIKTFIQQLQLEKPSSRGVELMVLSPYTRQVALLNNELRRHPIPEGFIYRRTLNAKNDQRDERVRREIIRPAHTVDSSQGNEADIVIVSLVRNNTNPTLSGLGFLSQPDRLNVLLSRAKSMLILVGSWEFFNYQVSELDLETDTENPLHWMKFLLETLHESFERGIALKIDYDDVMQHAAAQNKMASPPENN